jgi:hypothetical protein
LFEIDHNNPALSLKRLFHDYLLLSLLNNNIQLLKFFYHFIYGGIMKYFITVVIIAILIGSTGCSDDKSSNPTNPNNPASNIYGSGSISFNADSIGNFSFSGSWTGAAVGTSGTAVEALTGKSGSTYAAIIYAHTWHSSNNWDNVILEITKDGTPITTGTYTATNGLTFMFTKGATSTSGGSNMFILDNGSCQITSYSSTGMKGTISGTATRPTDQATISITNGTFDVTFGSYSM